jgi:imidazolonepropionase-like amidohydrolase
MRVTFLAVRSSRCVASFFRFSEEACMRRVNVLFPLLAAIVALFAQAAPASAQAVIYRGARIIVGDGTVIANGAFAVQNGLIVAVGIPAAVSAPDGAAIVDLAGKTVMPTMVDMHGHIGYQDIPNGTMSKAMFTRANLIDHLQRLAYAGVGAIVSIGDLVDRSDLHGGRTGWGDVPLKMRDEIVPGAAMFKTAGAGISWPGSGAQGHPSRADVMYPVTTVAEARAAVDDYVLMKPEFIKIWADDRGGTKKTLTPELYGAILDEAHKFNVPVGVHNVKLVDAKNLMRDGMEGWLHVPVRGGEAVDDELIGIVKDRIARNDRPLIWMIPALITAWMDTQGGRARPEWLDDPLLKAMYSPADIERHWGDPLRKMTAAQVAKAKRDFALQASNAMKLRAAGMIVVDGTDTGQTRFWIGYFNHLDLESMVAIGMTPGEAIEAATGDGARVAHLNTGLIAGGRQADFIVLDADPLENIANTRRIDKVFLRGAEVPRAQYAAKWRSQFH